MTTDNRANEPTDAQEPSRLPDFFAPKPMPNSYVPAPVLPSSGVIGPPLHPDEREPIALNPLLRGVDLALDRLIRRDCFSERTLRVIDELRDEITHQVLPSSGIDEDALAEVIEAEIDKLRHETRLYPDIYKAEVARAVAEWLRTHGLSSEFAR